MNKYYLLFLAAVTIASFGQVALKKGALEKKSSFLRQYFNRYVFLGYGLLFLSIMFVSYSYREVALKEGPILESLTFILVPLQSSIFFQERLSIRRIVGFSIIILGVVVFLM